MALLISNPILNAISGAGAVTLSGRILSVSGTDPLGSAWIDMDYTKISINPRPVVQPSLAETLQKQTFTFVAANATTYSFVINQDQPDGTRKSFPITVISATTGATAATISAQINAAILAKSGAGLRVTSSGGGTVITIIADTGYPVFTVTNAVNGTVAAAAAMTIAYASSTDATPAVFTSAAHGLTSGQYIVLGGAPTAGSPAAVATAAGGSRRVTVLTANTFSVEGTVATGTPDVAGGTVTLQPQFSRGLPADLTADGITGGVAGNTYSQVLFVFGQPDTMSFEMTRDREMAQRLWINEADANYAVFLVRLNEYLNAYNAGATTANPEAVALTQ